MLEFNYSEVAVIDYTYPIIEFCAVDTDHTIIIECRIDIIMRVNGFSTNICADDIYLHDAVRLYNLIQDAGKYWCYWSYEPDRDVEGYSMHIGKRNNPHRGTGALKLFMKDLRTILEKHKTQLLVTHNDIGRVFQIQLARSYKELI